MKEPLKIPFSQAASTLGEAGFSPLLPVSLSIGEKTTEQLGLLDTGASVNVLPYPVGLALGLDWGTQTIPLQLTGNLANLDARAVLIHAKIGAFDPVRLAFAWTMADRIPLILGQTNFFMEFDVCFFRSQLLFEVKPKKV